MFAIVDIEPSLLRRERERTRSLLAPVVPPELLHEVGSTAMPGVIGKQDLDFLVRVPRAAFTGYRDKLDLLLTRNPDQLSNEVYQGYTIESELDVAVQLTVADGPHDTFLEFRELLRSDAALVNEYNDLKRQFDGQPMDAYRKAKGSFIERTLRNEGL